MNGDLAEALVAESEGLELEAYKDTRGFWTIGYGHLLQQQDKDWTGYTISWEQAEELLGQDMQSARVTASEFPHFDELSDVRQAVLVSMCFQLGSKPLHWPVFMQCLTAQDYVGACSAGLDSDWAKETPARAQREMTMLRTGNWALSA